MADFASSLPIRTESAGDVVSQICDSLVPSQRLTINADGSINITDNNGSITVDGSVTVSATDLDIRNLVFATDKVDASGSSVSITSPGTAINDYNTVASVAMNATSTHTYTSTGNFYLNQVAASSSGKLKIVIKVNSITKFVFFTSTAQTNLNFILQNVLLATTGQTVTVERTNLDKEAADVYSTISGYTV